MKKQVYLKKEVFINFLTFNNLTQRNFANVSGIHEANITRMLKKGIVAPKIRAKILLAMNKLSPDRKYQWEDIFYQKTDEGIVAEERRLTVAVEKQSE